jgi:hypothetical protein
MASISRWGRLWSVLRVPSVIGLSVVLFGVYSWFDLRAAGLRSSLTTTEVTTFDGLVAEQGMAWVVVMVVLNALLAVTAAVLVVESFRLVKARRSAAATGACTAGGGLLLGLSTFGCPSCTIPLLGTLGLTFAASSLPFAGLEFKVIGLAITSGILYWMLRPARQFVR